MPPRVVREDIPVARRSTRAALPDANPLRPVIGTTLVLITAAAALVVLFRDPLRNLLSPAPVAGLNVRQSADGRLLGHFPFNETPDDQLVEVAPGLRLQRDAAESLLAMQRAAATEGVDLRLLSAFRPVRLQKKIFFDVKAERNQSADERAQVSAPPGFSEHSTGYAVDLGDGRLPAANLAESFEGTPAFRWLELNANRFHFQLSFPRRNRQGVSYEPWHWRFEGSAEALRIFEPARRLAGNG